MLAFIYFDGRMDRGKLFVAKGGRKIQELKINAE
jgi:hypothetical protein